MVEALSKHDLTMTSGKRYSLEFIPTMVQTLNTILLTCF